VSGRAVFGDSGAEDVGRDRLAQELRDARRGTAIGNAVGVALNRLKTSRAKSKAVILLTDGDSNSGNISPEEAAEFATNDPEPDPSELYTDILRTAS